MARGNNSRSCSVRNNVVVSGVTAHDLRPSHHWVPARGPIPALSRSNSPGAGCRGGSLRPQESAFNAIKLQTIITIVGGARTSAGANGCSAGSWERFALGNVRLAARLERLVLGRPCYCSSFVVSYSNASCDKLLQVIIVLQRSRALT